jgi:MFS family permease
MDQLTSNPARASDGIGAPLRQPVFRRIWLASLLSNFGMLIQGVGAAWAMTLMTSSADKVALVQTAAMLPTMLISIAAGAIADMYDRRLVSLVGLSIALAGATTLSGLTFFNVITPNILLLFCFIVGTGMALFGPSWQASVSEQVSPETLPAAVALTGISYNIARSFGPAIGGVIVAAAGAGAAFVANALLYLPLLIVLYFWRRQHEPSRLPPEGLRRAMVSGVRYIVNSPQTRVVLTRTLTTGVIGGAAFALMPLVARDLLGGNAQTYGLMLGAFGLGAVIGALNIAKIRRKIDDEKFVRVGAMIMGLSIAVAGLSRSVPLTIAALVVTGAMWTTSVTIYNIGVQLSAPRWVAGRALASFQTAIAGGIAAGSWAWGHTADAFGVDKALLIAGALMFLSPLLGIRLRMPSFGAPTSSEGAEILADPQVHLLLNPRSGPIIVEIEYRVDAGRAREFYSVMQEVQLTRQRTGAYGWSIARDITDPELWTERYHCPTWHDYLRQRNRPTQAERSLTQSAQEFHTGSEPVRIRRMLERPFGSVRWKEDTPDRGPGDVLPISAPTSGA